MLRVRVCAAHMGGFLGPKFSRQGSLFRQIFHKHGWVFQKLAKNSHKCPSASVHPQVMYPKGREWQLKFISFQFEIFILAEVSYIHVNWPV